MYKRSGPVNNKYGRSHCARNDAAGRDGKVKKATGGACMPGYDVSVRWGLLGPAKMPAEFAAKIQADLKTALQDPIVQNALDQIGATAIGSTRPNSMHSCARRGRMGTG
jgi:hypothetical protein